MTISFSTFKGDTVFHLMPYYSGLSGSLSRSVERIGSSFGYSKARSVQTYSPYSTPTYSYIVEGKENISVVNDLFDTLRGRWASVWFPSWMEDFKLEEDIDSDETVWSVEYSADFGTMYPIENKTGWYIFIYVNQNEWYARRISGYSVDNTISIDGALGKAYTKERIKFISFLYKGRLDFDVIEWNYKTPTVAECKLAFMETPFEYTSTTTTTTTTA